MLQLNLVVQVNLAIEIGKETIISPFFPYLLFSQGGYYLYIESNINSWDC